MSSIIYYFSATGNSLELARVIAKELNDCIIKPIQAQPSNELANGTNESIGFVFPVYYAGMPRLVKQFVEKLEIHQGTYCFAVVNFGGYGANTLGMLADVLQNKGISLAFADEVKMPGNYIVKYPAFPPDKVQKLIKMAVSKVEEVAKAIAKREIRPVKTKAVLFSKLVNHICQYKDIAKWDEKFVTSSKCDGCGLCANVCPVDNIEIEEGRPVWQHHCERCLACIQWCPCVTIQYGKKTIGRKRYLNPNIKVTDIINLGKRGK